MRTSSTLFQSGIMIEMPRLLAVLMLALGMLDSRSSFAQSSMSSMKKGVGYWSNDGVHHGLAGSGVSWCYDWGVAPVGTAVRDIEFVPMVWGKKTH